MKYKYKRGNVREDGKVFLQYVNGKEYWLTVEKFNIEISRQKERNRKFYLKNKEKVLERTSAWRKNNPDKFYLYSKNYWARNPDKKKEKIKREYIARRSCPRRKFIQQVRNLINNSISKKFVKSNATENILGCSISEFRLYIESLFKNGMTWENHGQWHLDHVIPLSVAKTIDQVNYLNHYANLRPLWAKENLAKKDRITEEGLLWTFTKNLDIKKYYNHAYV